ncbi:hypothetical protein LTR95_016616 [Oleoguttula sp. CCFEE 5521]
MDDMTISTAKSHSAMRAHVKQRPTPAKSFINLPTELRISVLERCADLDDLRSLAGSCTAYHQAYLSARAPILSLVLKRITGPWLEDLVLMVEAGTLTQTFNWAEKQEPVIALLDRYRRGTLADWHGTNTKSQFAPNIFSLEQCLSLVQAIRMVDWTCDRICRQYASKLSDDSAPTITPSSIERIRLSRAICRYKAFCALMPSACQSTTWNADAACDVFLRIFPTWEIEEIACIYEFLQYEYGCVLIEIAKHFCSLHPTADVNGWKKEEGYFDAFEPFDIRPGYDERTLADARRRYAETTPFGHFDMRYWGYVFWDEERLQAMGLPSEYAPFVLNSIFDWDKWRTHEEEVWTREKAAPISDHWDYDVFTKRVLQ